MAKVKRKLLPGPYGNEDGTPAKQSKYSKEDGESMFSIPWQNSDAVLVVEDKELHVHTSILSIASKYFEKMFNGNFEEAESKRVTLEGKSFKLVDHMLRMIYPVKSGLNPKDLLCNVCLFNAGTPSPGDYGSYVIPTESNSADCQQCGVSFVKKSHHERLLLEHLQKLYQLSEEFFMDTITEKVIAEITRQSKSISGLPQAFFLLETAESIEAQVVKEACFDFLGKHLNSMKILKKYSTGLNYSLETRMKLKGFILRNLIKMLNPQKNKDKMVVNECQELAGQLIGFDVATELGGAFLNTAFSSPC